MPLLLIPLIAAGAVGLFGAGNTVKAVINNSKVKDVNERVNNIREKVKARIASCKEVSDASLKALGSKKVMVLTTG